MRERSERPRRSSDGSGPSTSRPVVLGKSKCDASACSGIWPAPEGSKARQTSASGRGLPGSVPLLTRELRPACMDFSTKGRKWIFGNRGYHRILGAAMKVHFEPYLYLAGLTHKSALIAWGGFYFRSPASSASFVSSTTGTWIASTLPASRRSALPRHLLAIQHRAPGAALSPLGSAPGA